MVHGAVHAFPPVCCSYHLCLTVDLYYNQIKYSTASQRLVKQFHFQFCSSETFPWSVDSVTPHCTQTHTHILHPCTADFVRDLVYLVSADCSIHKVCIWKHACCMAVGMSTHCLATGCTCSQALEWRHVCDVDPVTRRNKWLAEACWSAWNVGWWKINLCCPCCSWLWTRGKVNSVSRALWSCLTAEGKTLLSDLLSMQPHSVSINISKLPGYGFLISLGFSWTPNAALNRARKLFCV